MHIAGGGPAQFIYFTKLDRERGGPGWTFLSAGSSVDPARHMLQQRFFVPTSLLLLPVGATQSNQLQHLRHTTKSLFKANPHSISKSHRMGHRILYPGLNGIRTYADLLMIRTQNHAEDPHQTSTDEPHQPSTEEPHQLSTDDPHQPSTEEPHQSSTEEPHQPPTDDPQQPSTDEPHQPSTEVPH